MATIKYFNGTEELSTIQPVKNAAFLAMGGVRSKDNAYDSFSRIVGLHAGLNAYMPVTRKIEYKSNPSMHKCDGRCLHAKGRICECACGGKNHGAGG